MSVYNNKCLNYNNYDKYVVVLSLFIPLGRDTYNLVSKNGVFCKVLAMPQNLVRKNGNSSF